ncbi:DNA mismatch repair protein MutS [Hydrogenobacter sp. Uz 6-8]|uniref:DNA mismatch repair protein MutS n=1 Tax=Hydrogenobacter sp. Uz 6-8 TaxID=3384828 RepID=UPI0038FCFDFC
MQEDLTPMLSQYHHFKRQYTDCLLFFRLGDFYELFYEDAELGSRELGLVLTSRPAGKGKERIPMCGVPYHSASSYISRLVSKGYRIAICEQVEDSAQAKGLVRRDVVRVITPGTYFEKESCGLAGLLRRGSLYMCAYLNPATGEFVGGSFEQGGAREFILKFSPRELLIPESLNFEIRELELFRSAVAEEYFYEGLKMLLEDMNIFSAKGLGFEREEELLPFGGLYLYLKQTQKSFFPFVGRPKPYTDEGYVRIDYRTCRGLELLESYEGSEKYSLFGVLNKTLTGMGRRRLRFHIMHPFREISSIERVQDAVEELTRNRRLLEQLRESLKNMPDLERLISRISGGLSTPRDIVQIKRALESTERIKRSLEDVTVEVLREVYDGLLELSDLREDIERTLVDDPPLHVREGGLIREGVDPQLDQLRYYRDNAQKLIDGYEAKLRKETGIQSLKIGFNRVMGYYVEVTKPNLRYVPPYFRRRQTLSNAERFTTDYLQELEEKILSAQSKINSLEYELFMSLRERILRRLEELAHNARLTGWLDYLQSLAAVAIEKGWVRPQIVEEKVLHIEEGRHPVIEEFVKTYSPNSTHMDEENFLFIITGPNMAGKSSYIRQTALLTLMAHMGSFLPCKSAKIGIVSSIHARIGSGDILALGVSTFMNEMLEVSSILNNADSRSLIVLDEVGRGTSTYDGIAISRAIVEYILEHIRARTLVATHFLELTEINRKGIRNYHMAVSKDGEDINFLYVLRPGRAEGSFGIRVAKKAGLPEEVVKRAKEVLAELTTSKTLPVLEKVYQESLREEERALLEELLQLDLVHLTPLQALMKLAELKEKLLCLRKSRS